MKLVVINGKGNGLEYPYFVKLPYTFSNIQRVKSKESKDKPDLKRGRNVAQRGETPAVCCHP